MLRKIVLSILTAVLFLPSAAAAEGMTLQQLQEKFPDGKYWNHPWGTPSNQDGWTETPCTPHPGHNHKVFDGACGCNCFSGLTIQCEGFGFQLQEDAFGEGYGVASYHHMRAVRDYETAMRMLKAGDVVRYKEEVRHSIFITAVDGDSITYADCNADATCRIRWNVQGTKSMLAQGFLYMDPGAWDLQPLSAEPVPPVAETPSVMPSEAVCQPEKSVSCFGGLLTLTPQPPGTVCLECCPGGGVVLTVTLDGKAPAEAAARSVISGGKIVEMYPGDTSLPAP